MLCHNLAGRRGPAFARQVAHTSHACSCHTAQLLVYQKAKRTPLSSKNCPKLQGCRERSGLKVSAASASGAAASPNFDGQSSNKMSGQETYLRVVGPTALALMLCNMDRICLSVAILPLSQEFGWTESVQGIVQSAFLYGYLATQILGGWLADRFGGKWVMAGGITFFSLASLLLPLVVSQSTAAAGLTLQAVLLARFCVGLGEGVALPSMNNLVATFIPPSLKATALGNCFTGFHCGNLLGLILSPFLLINYGWRALFYVFGLLGAPLVAMWLATVPARPLAVKAAPEAAPSGPPELGDGQWKGRDAAASSSKSISPLTLMSRGATWAIIIVNFINHWGYFIYLNWMPSYFAKTFGLDLRASGFMAFTPWLVMAFGSSAAGILADKLVARGTSVTAVRKGMQCVAFLVPALALLALCQPGLSPSVAVLLMTLALSSTSLGLAGYVANMSDVAPDHAGQMYGLCSTWGTIAGILGVTSVGFVLEATGSFALVFRVTAALYVVGTAVYCCMCTAERQF